MWREGGSALASLSRHQRGHGGGGRGSSGQGWFIFFKGHSPIFRYSFFFFFCFFFLVGCRFRHPSKCSRRINLRKTWSLHGKDPQIRLLPPPHSPRRYSTAPITVIIEFPLFQRLGALSGESSCGHFSFFLFFAKRAVLLSPFIAPFSFSLVRRVWQSLFARRQYRKKGKIEKWVYVFSFWWTFL